MKYDVLNRFSGEVQFTAEIDCADDAAVSVKLGLAVKWAVKTKAYLSGADLSGANLARANLADAYLAGASLSDANLADASLVDANLVRANLARANLVRANLARANLADAYLADANLAGANLADANLAGANLVIDAGTPNGWRCVGWLRAGCLSVRVGCHDKRLDEGRAYWAGKEDRHEVLAALDYVEAVAKLRGWALEPAKKEAA